MRNLSLQSVSPGALEVRADDLCLLRYVFSPEVPANESPRPYLHPMYSLDGDVLTNFRPNDHPWHHGMSLTLTQVDGVNFWGGPSHRREDGYAWRGDHGRQVHVDWLQQSPRLLEHLLEWRDQKDRRLLRERRQLTFTATSDEWSLRWTSVLTNVTDHDLRMHNYHSLGGLEGSHYTGLQFRGARGLLDEHGDSSIEVIGPDGARGEAQVHGQTLPWVEWHAQHDGSLRRTRIRFESLQDPIPWFVRRGLPLVSFSFHREQATELAPGAELVLDHQLTFSRA